MHRRSESASRTSRAEKKPPAVSARAGMPRRCSFTRVSRRKTVGTAQQDTAVGPAQRPFPFPFPDTQPLPLFPQKDGETAAFLHGHFLFFLGSGQIQ